MSSIREEIYLAALLHDIGKFYQRADTGVVNTSQRLSDITKNNISTVCPTDGKGGYSYKHVLWTSQFFEDHHNMFKNVLPDKGETSVTENLQFLSSGHHLKQKSQSVNSIIQIADHCSTGMDRSKLNLNNDENTPKQWNEFMNTPLRSLFAGAFGEKRSVDSDYPVAALNTSEFFFPSNQTNIAENYKNLWQQFEKEFKDLPVNNFDIFTDSLYYLLYRYTCNIPSSTIDFPDISLFDHSKTTAALALCLYDHSFNKSKGNEFLLIGADVSGIQSFIYDISSKGASKNLKGRSFYIQVLLQTIATSIIKGLQLKPANVIYNSGGAFFILAPNTSEAINLLNDIKNKIEKKIFQEHGVNLYVALSYTAFASETLLNSTEGNNLGLIWSILSQELNRQKRSRYQNLMEDYDVFFKPSDTGGVFPKDSITGEEFLISELKDARNPVNANERTDISKAPDSDAIRPLTAALINLGRWMKDADYWIISSEPINLPCHIEPLEFGIHHYFLSDKQLIDVKSKGKSFDNALFLRISGGEKGEIVTPQNTLPGNNTVGFDFYGGNDYPSDEKGEPLSFDELCEGDFKRLGVLRMDVDNLGRLFKEGYQAKTRSLSRMAGISRSLDWFFKGYLNTLIKSNKQYSERCFVIYSGGDDLFIIGQWNVLLALADNIQEKFEKWVCRNPFVTISGGMAMVTGKYPIMKAADLAGDAEEIAKKHCYPNNSHPPEREKNAIAFLEYPLDWKNEYKVVKNLKEELCSLYMEKETIPRSLLGKISSHHNMAQIVDGLITNPRAYWILAYDLGRMRQRTKGEKISEWINTCIKDIHQNTIKGGEIPTDYHTLELYNLAARWAELELRTINN
jgi:CRISPR-associated protein Csm1